LKGNRDGMSGSNSSNRSRAKAPSRSHSKPPLLSAPLNLRVVEYIHDECTDYAVMPSKIQTKQLDGTIREKVVIKPNTDGTISLLDHCSEEGPSMYMSATNEVDYSNLRITPLVTLSNNSTSKNCLRRLTNDEGQLVGEPLECPITMEILHAAVDIKTSGRTLHLKLSQIEENNGLEDQGNINTICTRSL